VSAAGRRLLVVGRLYTSGEVEDMLAQVSGERDAAWAEVGEARAQARVLSVRVGELQRQAAEDPSEVARLSAECERWAARAGAAEAEAARLAGALARSFGQRAAAFLALAGERSEAAALRARVRRQGRRRRLGAAAGRPRLRVVYDGRPVVVPLAGGGPGPAGCGEARR